MLKKALFVASIIPAVCLVAGLGVIGISLKLFAPIHDHFYYTKHLQRPSSGKSKGL